MKTDAMRQTAQASSRWPWLLFIFLSTRAMGQSLDELGTSSLDEVRGKPLDAAAVEFRGNLALPAEVYREVLAEAGGTPSDAPGRLEDFLRRAGYELAHVSAHSEGGRLIVDISEGQLEKVVFKGRLTFQMVRFKLAFLLPQDVFNRPALERQIQGLSAELGISPPTWELVPTAEVSHVGPQVETFGEFSSIQGFPLVKPMRKYELHISFASAEWTTGIGIDLRITYFDGVELGVNSKGIGLLSTDDRWRVGIMGGAAIRQDILHNEFYAFPSRLMGEAQWHSPAIARALRGFLWLQGEALARQRRDPALRLENYFSTNAQLTANLQLQGSEGFQVYLGAGLQRFTVFGARAPEGEVAPLELNTRRWRSLLQLGGEWSLGLLPDSRWDRRHALTFDARLWGSLERLDEPIFGEVHLLYQKVLALGWHDVWLKARGDAVRGDVLFPFEIPLGEYLRGNFGDVFVRLAGGGRAEFRFSLTRDVYKLGLFVEAVGFGELDRATDREIPRLGVAFGPGFHALVVGMFQLDMNVSFAMLSTGRFSTGLWAALVKAY